MMSSGLLEGRTRWTGVVTAVLVVILALLMSSPAFAYDPLAKEIAARSKRLKTGQINVQRWHNNGEMHTLFWDLGDRRLRWLSPGIEGNEYGWWGQNYYVAKDVEVPATTSLGRTPPSAGTTQQWYSYINWYDGVPGDIILEPSEVEYLEGGEVQYSHSIWNIPIGITIERRGVSYSNSSQPGVSNSFIIWQYTWKNTGDWDGDGIPDSNQDLKHFSIGFRMDADISSRANFTDEGGYWRDDMVGGDMERGISYEYDGDNPGSVIPDYGAPDPGMREIGMLLFRSPGYCGFAPLFVTENLYGLKDRPYIHLPFFNKQEMGNSAVSIAGALNGATIADDYNPASFLDGTNGPRGPSISGNPDSNDPVNFYWNPPTTSVFDYRMLQVYGPWDLAFGDSVQVVQVQMVGIHIDPGQPETEEQIKRGEFDDRPTDEGIKAVYDFMRKSFDRWVVNNNNDPTTPFDPTRPGGFGFPNSPNPPQAPRVYVAPNPAGGIRVSWDDAAESYPDPDYTGSEANDFAGYIVYKSAAFPDKGKANGPYKEIARFPKGQAPANDDPDLAAEYKYAYTDEEVLIGFDYWYYVAAYDEGHSDWDGTGAMPPLESYQALNVNQNLQVEGGGYPAIVPKSPLSEGVSVADVKVVPNPYFVTAAWGQRVKFINLPTSADIDIFTINGEFVQHIDHRPSASGTVFAEKDWDLKNFNGQLVASGVYIARVTSAVNTKIIKVVIAQSK